MLFNSLEFAFFFLVVFALYYSPVFKTKQAWFLVAASLVFYAWGQPGWLFLLLLSIGINSLASWQIMKSDDQKFKVWCASICITLNVILLACFKYAALSFSVLSKIVSLPPSVASFADLALPVGISFYTFEGISLLVDSVKKSEAIEVAATRIRHVLNTSLFFSFFPHLAAGPIVRPHQFYPQIGAKQFKEIDWKLVIESLIVGYFFKNVVADNLAVHTSAVLLDFAAFSGKDTIAALVGYSARIFADFAGYSLIAIGLAAALGYKLPTNFNFPYRSQSLSEFWTRWHITLSTWIRDYLYIPLGGNKKGKFRTYMNLLLVMFLGGLWHGGKVGFAVWGLYHGVGLCVERALGLSHKSSKSKVLVASKVAGVFIFVTAGWLLFATPLHMVPHLIEATIFNWSLDTSYQHLFLICLFSMPVFIWHSVDLCFEKIEIKSTQIDLCRDFVLAVMAFLVVTDSGVPQDFFYFQF
ncbi:MAG: MBOAT family protein [Cyanobacteria bacterium SZAS-4]|nr:MBOAT family protein [Cyanobacteria bacterium SZAS-4]